MALALVVVLAGCGSAEQGTTETTATSGSAPDLVGSEWILAELNGAGLLPGTNITLSFDEGSAGGFGGCNAYGGSYEKAGGGALSFSTMEMTLQFCLEPQGVMEQEEAYLAALQKAAAYRAVGDRLEIEDGEGELLLVLLQKARADMDPADLLGTEWRLVSLNGAAPVEGSTITIEFADDGSASGMAGCREYTATYAASGDEIRFPSQSMSGDDACLEDEAIYLQEGRFTDALTWATNYRLGEGRLEIETARGEVLSFEPSPRAPAVRPEHAGPGFPPTDYGCTSSFHMVWSSHRLDGLSQEVQEALEAADIEGVDAIAEAYGEDWFEQGGEDGSSRLCNFSVMETDFRITLAVETLADLDGLGALLARVLTVLDQFPPADTPGQQPGYVKVVFVSRGNGEGWAWFSITEAVQAREDGLAGAALLDALHYQVSNPTPEPGASSDGSDLKACAPYLDLVVSFEGGEGQAIATSYQCGGAHVDSTGQTPRSSISVPVNAPLWLRSGAGTQPQEVEARIYPGAAVSASFFRWPEDLPTGVEPVVQIEQVIGPDFEIRPELSRGDYSMVVRAIWAEGAEVFYAFNFRLE